MDQTNIEPTLSCLAPVDFVHVIRTCKPLYERYQSEIQEKKKQSLVRFSNYNEIERLHHRVYRGTKLSNGKMEGKFELLTNSHCDLYNYINEVLTGDRVVYNYIRYVAEKDKKSFNDSSMNQFEKWKDIDVSDVKLEANDERWHH